MEKTIEIEPHVASIEQETEGTQKQRLFPAPRKVQEATVEKAGGAETIATKRRTGSSIAC